MLLTKRFSQSGFVLPTALIFLIIMTLIAITAIRRATSDEKISGNIRTQNIAFQAAESALRFCQRDLEASAPGGFLPLDAGVTMTASQIPVLQYALPSGASPINPPMPSIWQDKANWTNVNAFTLPANTIINVTTQPQCMIEEWPFQLAGKAEVKKAYVITARGIGSVDTSVVWLQVIIRPGSI
jgi:type IV pilus assembly protein PilX